MLKIKDNVDLKELEKFGFKKDEDDVYSVGNGYQKLCWSDGYLYLYEKSFNTNTMILHCDVLYDLIKANLVEKVVE